MMEMVFGADGLLNSNGTAFFSFVIQAAASPARANEFALKMRCGRAPATIEGNVEDEDENAS